MTILSEKYIAGFLDSDGSIQCYYRKPTRTETNKDHVRLYIGLEFTQLTRRDDVLKRIQEAIGGSIYFNEKRNSTVLKLFGKEAEMVLNRIRKYLVIKRHYATIALSMARKVGSRKEISSMLKIERKKKSMPLPNFPSRKWLAGYFDGDGSISARMGKGRASAQPTVEIVSSDFDAEGIELIYKVFGGSINKVDTKRRHLSKWVLTLPPSKAKQFFSYFAKYLVIKKDQADFILGCAEMGHYRDGKSINTAMKQLKSQPHRLNESGSVKVLLSTVKNISNAQITSMRRTLMANARTFKEYATVG